MSSIDLKKAGEAARRLLEFAWKEDASYLRLIRDAIDGVCKTLESNPKDSVKLLRRIIEPERLRNYGYIELRALVRNLEGIIPFDPVFVRDVYIEAFKRPEQPKGALQYGTQLHGLVEPHDKAYEHNLYLLTRVYPEFIKQSPQEAARVVAAAVRQLVEAKFKKEAEHPIFPTLVSRRRERREIKFEDQKLYLTPDDSYRPSFRNYERDETMEILDSFISYLSGLCHEEKIDKIEQLIDILFESEELVAVIWKSLLEVGTSNPITLGRIIRSLAWSKPILEEPDTTYEVGEFIRAIYPHLNRKEKLLVEQIIISISEEDKELQEWAEERRNRLLSCLPVEEIVDKGVKELLEKLSAKGDLIPNRPLITVGTSSSPYTTQDYLREKGVPVDDPEHSRILELAKPLTKFAKDFLNEIPTNEDAEKIFPALKEFYKVLKEAGDKGIKEDLMNQGWDWLADLCAILAKMKDLSCEDELGQFVKEVLLEAATTPVPEYDEFRAKQFDQSQGVGKPAPRVEAVLGLTRLGRHKDCLDKEILGALDKLSQDQVPEVRYEIASHLPSLYHNAKEMMWRLIERFALEDQSLGVLNWFLYSTLNWPPLLLEDTDRVVTLTKAIYDRIKEGDRADEVRRWCRSVFLKALLWKDHNPSREVIEEIIKEPETRHKECQDILSSIREVLIYGRVAPPDPQAEGDRRRAIDLFQRVVEITKQEFMGLQERLETKSKEQWAEDEKDQYQNLKEILTIAGRELYYASGALDLKSTTPERKPPPIKVRKRFFEETGEIIESLAEIDIAALCSHLLEVLETQVEFDPLIIFLRIGKVVKRGHEDRLEFDYVVVKLFVNLVERYLAEYPNIFRENDEAWERLKEMLDIFVDAGWPEALRLTYRFGDIYR